MAVFKPAYLIHGDDHGRVGERRARLRALAEAESGAGGVEVIEGEAATPANVAAALSAMTFAIGRRFVIVDGAERWREADVEGALAPVLAAIAPDTTVAFFAREDGRAKAPKALHRAVLDAGGDVAAEQALKARDLPKWLVAEATRLGAHLDGAAAHALVAHVGERQQRLLRELEKLVLEHSGPDHPVRIGVEEVDAAASISAEHQVWGLVDALVARDEATATRRFVELRAQGETMPRLVPLMARRVREVLGYAARLEAGESPAQLKASATGSPWAAERRIKEARAADPAALRAALVALADLELDTRGASELDDDTAGVIAIASICER